MQQLCIFAEAKWGVVPWPEWPKKKKKEKKNRKEMPQIAEWLNKWCFIHAIKYQGIIKHNNDFIKFKDIGKCL